MTELAEAAPQKQYTRRQMLGPLGLFTVGVGIFALIRSQREQEPDIAQEAKLLEQEFQNGKPILAETFQRMLRLIVTASNRTSR